MGVAFLNKKGLSKSNYQPAMALALQFETALLGHTRTHTAEEGGCRGDSKHAPHVGPPHPSILGSKVWVMTKYPGNLPHVFPIPSETLRKYVVKIRP